jgi:predicted Zn-dependent protease
MTRQLARYSAATILVLFQTVAVAQKPPATTSLISRALEDEVKRAMDVLKQKGNPGPYFIGYEVNDIQNVEVEASLGATRNSNSQHSRFLDIDVRVGDYQYDNTHQIRGQRGGFGGGGNNFTYPVAMPLDDDIDALKSVIWLETDRRYKNAVERLIQVKANRTIKVDEEDTSADFSREKAQTAALEPVIGKLNSADWEKKAKAYSAMFNKYPEIYDGTVTMSSTATNQYVVNSEGTSTRYGKLQMRLSFYARTKADDGMDLNRFEAFDVHSLDHLPSEAVVRQTIEKMVADLKALRQAPVIEPFTGPAILSGRASGVFFHEIFGHRIEGQRQKNDNEGQTFTKRVNQLVLPDFISVVDDPTLKQVAGVDLNGTYAFDDDGVAAQRVTVVDKGILKNFLLSRSPVTGFEQSNGHGRKAPGYGSVGRQGNLIVEASKTVSEKQLRQMLIDETKRQGKQFGLFFEDISGGFTTTTRSTPQAFQVTPIMVYRVYVDGRPDELVRGVDLIGTPLTSFSKIVAAGDKQEVFNGFCGAESGYVPVSAVAPSILTTQIEVQKKSKSSERPPILPPPPGGGALQ